MGHDGTPVGAPVSANGEARPAAPALARVDVDRLAELGHQAAVLVHQLRQPLFGVRGLVQLAEADPEHASEHLAAARAQLDVLDALVAGWADFSRRPGRAGEPLDLRAPVESALVLLRHRAATLGVGVHADLGPGVLVRSSLLALQQAVVNLGQNALEALEGQAGGRLVVVVEASSVIIEDNGPGLAPEVQSALFRPFVTTKAHGTGLGLTTARALVHDAGGELRLDRATPGVRWRIVLPAAP